MRVKVKGQWVEVSLKVMILADWLMTMSSCIFEPTCAYCTVGSYASLLRSTVGMTHILGMDL